MNKAWAAKKGFTIIELLVSIVVIGILVTIMIVSYNGIQQRSRDSQRGSHMTLLSIAIEKYHGSIQTRAVMTLNVPLVRSLHSYCHFLVRFLMIHDILPTHIAIIDT